MRSCLSDDRFGAFPRRRRRVWLPVAVAAVALALVSAALRWYGDLVPPLLAWTDYPLIEGWHLPVGLMGVGTLVRHLPRRQTRRLLYVAGAVILAYGVWSAAMRFLVTFGDLTGRPDGRGLCPETSNYSCGAAALATWLTQLGVTADERELARLTLTQRFGGASPLGLLRAARIKLAGRPLRPVLRRLSWEELAALKRPCVIVVRHSLLVDHSVTVLGVEGDRVSVADPLWSGVAVWSRRELEDRRRRIALIAQEIGG